MSATYGDPLSFTRSVYLRKYSRQLNKDSIALDPTTDLENGKRPSRAAAKMRRPPVKIEPFREPKVEQAMKKGMTYRPKGFQTTDPTSKQHQHHREITSHTPIARISLSITTSIGSTSKYERFTSTYNTTTPLVPGSLLCQKRERIKTAHHR